MTYYVVAAELDGPEVSEDALDLFAPWPAAIGVTPDGRPSVTITLESSNLGGAVASALPLIRHATGRDVVAVSGMTEAERDAREGIEV